MTTMHDAILDVVRGNSTADEKIRIISTLISDENRWTSLYIIWGLIAVGILSIVALIVFFILINRAILKVDDFPQGIIAFGSFALGALAAYLVPPSNISASAPAALAQPVSAPAVALAQPGLAPAALAPPAPEHPTAPELAPSGIDSTIVR
jgi:hypothetical protein